MSDRLQYFVVLHEGQWKISFEGKHYGPYQTQAAAIEEARKSAKKAHDQGRKSQVLVQSKDNTFRTEWTYGDDPRNIPG